MLNATPRLEQVSDNDLMLEVKSGRLDRLGVLFDRHSRGLFKFFYRMTGDRELSEDLVQNVFLRMLKYRHTFTGDGKFITWMYHLARNAGADHFKKNRHFRFARELNEWENYVSEPATGEERMQHDEEIRLLQSAMNRLSPEKREVLVLSRYQELKYDEIARILKCTEGNVKVKVFRALQDLKQIYHRLLSEKNHEV